MNLDQLLQDKSIKSKVPIIAEWILKGELEVEELMSTAERLKGPDKANCIEAIEFATKKNSNLSSEILLNFVSKTLKDDEPRVKWESAKVISNIAKHFPNNLTNTIKNLLINVEHKGTVVRWATVMALGEILKMKTKHNVNLLPIYEKLSKKEKQNGVKKKYLAALKFISVG